MSHRMRAPFGFAVTMTPLVQREAFWTAANAISLSRVAMAGLVWLAPGDLLFVGSLMALAAASDLLDGMVARREWPWQWHRGSRRVPSSSTGEWLDPLCDKTFVVSLLAAIWVEQRAGVWLLLLIGTREIIQVPSLAVSRLVPPFRRRVRPLLRSALLGKLTTALQFAAAAAVLLGVRGSVWLAAAAGASGAGASAYYIRRAVKRAPAPSPPARPPRPQADRDVAAG